MNSKWSIEDILMFGFGWGSSDVDFFLKRGDEFNEELNKTSLSNKEYDVIEDALEELKSYDNETIFSNRGIDTLITLIYSNYARHFKDIVLEYLSKVDDAYFLSLFDENIFSDDELDELETKLKDYEFCVYSNFMDTHFTGIDLNQYTLTDENSIVDFLEDFYEL
jgi:hypothetical protein